MCINNSNNNNSTYFIINNNNNNNFLHYKDDLCHEGRKELLDMIKLPQALHRAITPDVRKELLSVVEGGDDKGVQKMTS